ncbi:deoxyribose-phosphate aldolase [Pseudodesulfovibrio nedwellii]|uniref:Deoxyribose-phosphate aldolase n=1 Tax=Pseudodesulfovibrio nedwellii TaxID=2973072 RepID=A0ABN6S6R9_9BACT|nr:deoxyribose-phosphate aldolase [Pseudodesulfovibrio nedwellii]BDQ38048.1 deoxyribose-phosphate aldolase [Pseudodesulfovibrio nedwellii]
MKMNDTLKNLVAEAQHIVANEEFALRTLASMDLTSLSENDTDDTIKDLCSRAMCSAGHVAAVCVYDRFVPLALKELEGSCVRVATVCNFPHGGADAAKAVAEAREQVNMGVHEVDVVMPYKRFKSGDEDTASALIEQVRVVCGEDVKLKVILETSQLQSLRIIEAASRAAIEAGADFIKTSTGKVPGGATLEVAAVMLSVIKEMQPNTNRTLGFKPSGGLKTVSDSAGFLYLADQIMGQGWATPQTLRFGASGILNDVLKELNLNSVPNEKHDY